MQPCDFRHPIASRQISLITVDVAQRYMASEYPREEDARYVDSLRTFHRSYAHISIPILAYVAVL